MGPPRPAQPGPEFRCGYPPADVLILTVHPPDLGPPHTKAAVDELNWDFQRYASLKELLVDPTGELIIFGRVGSNLFQYLDAHTRCRLRLFSEERGGMKALGRDERGGEVKSLMGRLVEELGSVEFSISWPNWPQGGRS